MRINTNMAALNAWRNMSANGSNLNKSLEKLSSGFRINRGADDAAGLAVSEKMRAQIRGTNMAIKNAQDGISLVQTAEGALTETHSILQRMRELAVQASTSTLTDDDRALVQEEFSELNDEITRIAETTKFNGKNLLDGTAGLNGTGSTTYTTHITGTTDTQTGSYAFTGVTLAADADDVYMANASSVSGAAADAFGSTSSTFQADATYTVNGKTYDVTAGQTTVQDFLDAVNTNSDETGVTAAFSGGNIVFSNSETGGDGVVSVSATSFAGDIGSISDVAGDTTDVSAAVLNWSEYGTDASATLAGATVVGKDNTLTVTTGDATGLSFDVESGAAAAQTITVSDNGTLQIQTGAEAGENLDVSLSDMRSSALNIDDLTVATADDASTAITSLDDAIESVSTERAKLGAIQNRLEHTVNSLSTASENLSAAESRVRDVDMAAEMANFTKYQILQQASTAMLAQANQSTQGVLSLLR